MLLLITMCLMYACTNTNVIICFLASLCETVTCHMFLQVIVFESKKLSTVENGSTIYLRMQGNHRTTLVLVQS